jgi:glycosyltransferase involved in cell wall biosynthesis
MSDKDYIITHYPLTSAYVEQLHEKFSSDAEPFIVSNITARSYLGIIKQFLMLKGRTLFLPIVDETARVILSPLMILCLFARAKNRFIIEPDLTFRKFGAVDGIIAALKMGVGVGYGLAALMRIRSPLRRLLALPRTRIGETVEKHVLYLKTNLWLGVQAGGSVAHTAGVVGGLINRGYGVDFASAETPIALPRSKALTVNSVAPPTTYVIPREVNHYVQNTKFIAHLRRWRKGRKIGFIYQRYSLGNYTGVALSRLWGLPLVLEFNGSEVWLARNWGQPLIFEGLADKVERACFNHAHLVVTVSDVLRNDLIARGVEPDRVLSCPNGVDTSVFNPRRFPRRRIGDARKRYGVPEDAVVATFVGTFGHWHGAEVLARTLRRMAKRHLKWLKKSRLHVVFVGDGGKRLLVEEILSEPALAAYFTLTGLIPPQDVPLIMAASDILVSPHVPNPDRSAFFGSPTKLFEYLASGRPVIGSDLYQVGEVLRGAPHVKDLASLGNKPSPEQCGVLVTAEKEGELASAIRFLVDHPDWRVAAGRNARKRAQACFTWDHHVGAILGRLAELSTREMATQPVLPTEKRTTVLFNALHSKSGGGVTYLKNVVPYLARDPGVDLHLCIHEEQRSVLPEDLSGVTVHWFDFKPGFFRLLLREQVEVPKLARRIGTDVTFSPANYGPLAAPGSVILLRNALSVAFVERRPVKLAYWGGVYLATVLSLLVCLRAVSVSSYARRTAGDWLLGLVGRRITVIPHGVGSLFAPAEGKPHRKDFLLAVSDIYVQKNLRNLIHALGHLRNTHPHVRLKIAGRPIDAHYFSSLKAIMAEEGLEDRVEFLGHVGPNGLADLYRQCAAFVFPSSVETFGNPLVEAMACGAPIASSNTAAMPEVAGDAALYFDPEDVDGMARVLDRLLSDGELRRDLSGKALKRARAFSWEKTAAQTLDVIKEAGSMGRWI